MSMMVSMGVTLIVMNGLSQLMIQKSKAIQRFQSKAQDVQTHIGFTKFLADVSSCSCLLNSQDAGNPIRGSLSVSVATVKSRQASSSTGPSITLPRLFLVPSDGETCNYADARVFAEPGGRLPGKDSGPLVDEITIDDIQLIGDSAGGPSGGFYHMKGLLTIAPKAQTDQDQLQAMRPLRQEIIFYTNPAGNMVSCDSSESIQGVFEEKSDQFTQSVEQKNQSMVTTYAETVQQDTATKVTTVESTVTNRYETTLRQGIEELNALLR